MESLHNFKVISLATASRGSPGPWIFKVLGLFTTLQFKFQDSTGSSRVAPIFSNFHPVSWNIRIFCLANCGSWSSLAIFWSASFPGLSDSINFLETPKRGINTHHFRRHRRLTKDHAWSTMHWPRDTMLTCTILFSGETVRRSIGPQLQRRLSAAG